MSEKYYIVSEGELKQAFNVVYETALYQGNCGPLNELERVLASCTARPVPEWAELYVDSFPDASKTEWIYKELKKELGL